MLKFLREPNNTTTQDGPSEGPCVAVEPAQGCKQKKSFAKEDSGQRLADTLDVCPAAFHVTGLRSHISNEASNEIGGATIAEVTDYEREDKNV